MELSRVILCLILCFVSLPDVFGEEKDGIQDNVGLLESEKSRSRHRFRLLFPLLLGVSSRLSTLVPSVMMILGGIFLLILFSKKAFVVSLIALYISLKSKFHKEDKKEVVYLDGYHHHHQGLSGQVVHADSHGYNDQHGYYDHGYYDHYR